jgi:hypothetical protein
LALAVDFNTYGEIGTKKDAGYKYVPIKLTESGSVLIEDTNDLNNALTKLKRYIDTGTPIKLNIAGNGIYSFHVKQEEVNNIVTKVIGKLLDNGVNIEEIRSGGQTGVDEAGIIAAQRLGIKNSIVAPRG